MSCPTSIYRYLNEDKNAVYNESRNIRDNLKYNLDEEYREKIKQKQNFWMKLKNIWLIIILIMTVL